jgi:hydroxymethylbilane synthase
LKIRVASRGSKLSRIQVKIVEEKLRNLGLETEFVEVKTKADLFQNEPLYKLGKGVFEKEVNEAVIRGDADIAVHSMKDMLTELPSNLEIYAVLDRESPLDALVSEKDFWNLESGSTIGTSSIRRKNTVKYFREDLQVRDLRGNIDTRIRKFRDKLYDAIIVADAALKRLKEDVNYYPLNPYDFTPEANQGIIAIVGKRDNIKLKEIISKINNYDVFQEALAERAAISIIGGGCHSPIGVLFQKDGEEYNGIISYISEKIKITITISKRGNPIEIGRELGLRLLREMKNAGLIS